MQKIITTAIARHVRMTPSKVRRIVNQIRGKSYKEALLILEYLPYSACKPVLTLIHSAGANAENNSGMNKSELSVSEVYVDPGPILKRFRPRAQGRGFKIQKLTCHIYLSLSRKEV